MAMIFVSVVMVMICFQYYGILYCLFASVFHSGYEYKLLSDFWHFAGVAS